MLAGRCGFNAVGIDSALREKMYRMLGEFLRESLLKNFNECVPDYFSLLFRVGDTLESSQECRARGNNMESREVARMKRRRHVFHFIFSQKSRVNKYRVELVADRLMKESCRDQRIHAARHPYNNVSIS